MIKTVLLLVLSFLLIPNSVFADGFLKTSGKKIVNSNGEDVLLRGINLGNWLIQEGYMMKTSSFANAEYQLRAKIKELIGEANTNEFYEAWFDNFITKKDIDQIAAWGFNSIRLPLHYNKLTPKDQPGVYIEEGFARIDSCLSWCEQNKIYLILDLHAAPGSQNGEGISDASDGQARLWTDESNKTRTIELWSKLAQRYADKEWIGGYDLINETKYTFSSGNAPLWDLMAKITSEIRKYDTNHIVFIEGNWYATDFNNLPAQLWDNNLVISFHKYWNETTSGTITNYINVMNKYNVPLYLGETGENSNAWFTEVIQLMESYNIGYAFWPCKKIDSISGLLTIPVPQDYQLVLNYWSRGGTKPTVESAKAALINLTKNLAFDKCKINNDVVDAMFRQVRTSELLPFAENKIPGRIMGVNYDLGRQGAAYKDKTYKNTNNSDAYNSGWSFRNDGVDIEKCSDATAPGFNVGWTETGDWLKYTVNVEQEGTYDTKFRISGGAAGGKILLKIDDKQVGAIVDVPLTGGYQSWSFIDGPKAELTAGTHTMLVQFFFGGFNYNFVEFTLSITGIDEEIVKHDRFALSQNYPNPFNPTTTIMFEMANKEHAVLKIYDILGKEIAVLVDEEVQPGMHEIKFDASSLASGIYYYTLNTGSFTAARKMIIMK